MHLLFSSVYTNLGKCYKGRVREIMTNLWVRGAAWGRWLGTRDQGWAARLWATVYCSSANCVGGRARLCGYITVADGGYVLWCRCTQNRTYNLAWQYFETFYNTAKLFQVESSGDDLKSVNNSNVNLAHSAGRPTQAGTSCNKNSLYCG